MIIILSLILMFVGWVISTGYEPPVKRKPGERTLGEMLELIKSSLVKDATLSQFTTGNPKTPALPVYHQPQSSVLEIAAAHDPVPTWFCVSNIPMSPAEEIISKILDCYRCEWFREVSFHEFRSEKSYYRFDFFVPSHKLIIEYDGQMAHSSPDRTMADQIKNSWCWNKGITVVRYNKKHYYSLATHISNLMYSHSIRKK